MTTAEPRYHVVHEDHIWDNQADAYVGLVADDAEAYDIVEELNKSSDPTTLLRRMIRTWRVYPTEGTD